MGFLERSKVRIRCVLASESYLPGELLTGSVLLHVREPISFSSIRLHVQGRECIETTALFESSTTTFEDEISHFSYWLTFCGPSKMSGVQVRQVYEPRDYAFPFTVMLPQALPPSYSVTTETARAQMIYTARAVMEISSGFDATHTTRFLLRSVAPQAQIDEGQGGGLERCNTAPLCRYVFLGCRMNQQNDIVVHVKAQVIPAVACTDPSDGSLPPSSSGTSDSSFLTAPNSRGCAEVVVRLHVLNHELAKPLHSVHVSLRNIQRVAYRSHLSTVEVCVGKATAPIEVLPGDDKEVLVCMSLKSLRARSAASTRYRVPLPSFTSTYVNSSYTLCVSFPRSNVSHSLQYPGLVELVEEATDRRSALRVPACYVGSHGRPREVRYVAIPSSVRIMEVADVNAPVGEQRENLYPESHEPYLVSSSLKEEQVSEDSTGESLRLQDERMPVNRPLNPQTEG